MSEKNGEKAKEIVKKFRENERVHTDEWDETRYLEQRIKQGFDQKDREYEALMGVLVRSLRNCLLLANREYKKYPEMCGHIRRLCKEGGVDDSILRAHPLVQEYLNKEKKP